MTDVAGWNNFDDVHARSNATTIRWPGGVDAEKNIEVPEGEDPVIINQYLGDGENAAQSYLNGATDDGGDTSFAEAVAFARETGEAITFVIPTNPLVNANGWLLRDDPANGVYALTEAKAELKAYIRNVLDVADGVTIKAFEIGNEFWGTKWASPGAYGEGAAIVAHAVDEVLREAAYADLADPDVLVQIWGDAHQGGANDPADFLAKNLKIIQAYDVWAGGDLSLIDGVAAHHYYKPGKEYGEDTNTTHVYATIDDRIDIYGQLKDAWEAAAGKDMELHFTEWNVAMKTLVDGTDLNGQDSDFVAYGLKQLAPTLELFSAMISNGAEAAQFWSALYKASALAREPKQDQLSDPDQGYGLHVVGQFFREELTQLEGYQYTELSGGGAGREVSYDTHLFTRDMGGDHQGVMYLSSLQEAAQRFDLNLLSLLAIPGTVSVEMIGIKDAPDAQVVIAGIVSLYGVPDYLQPGALMDRWVSSDPTINMLTGMLTDIELGAYEIAKITFDMYEAAPATTDARDVIQDTLGTDDYIDAKGGNDWIRAGDGRDYVNGGDGDDGIYGGTGEDILLGGAGNDFITGGFGAYTDLIDGGSGKDKIQGDPGDDVLTGGSGADEFRFFTGDGADRITDFEAGVDKLIINGTELNDLADLPSGVSGTTVDGNYVLSYGSGDSITIEATPDLIAAFPTLFGSNPDPTYTVIQGNDDFNVLIGTEGADIFYDLAGKDEMRGNGGDDIFVMSVDEHKDEILDFTAGEDRIDISAWGVTDISDLRIDQDGTSVRIIYAAGGDGARIELMNTQLANITASSFLFADGSGGGTDPDPSYNEVTGDDTDNRDGPDGDFRLVGTDGADRITDGAGRDEMLGRGGADLFVLSSDEAKDDILDFTSGEDRIDISAWGVTDISDLRIDQDGSSVRIIYETGGNGERIELMNTLLGDISGDSFIFAGDSGGGSGPDPSYNEVTGDDTDNRDGPDGDFRLVGTDGADRFTDGAGRDEMQGRGGADLFVLSADNTKDDIIDFTSGEDRIDVSAWGVTDMSMLSITQDGGHARVKQSDNPSEFLELQHFDAALLTADDFLFA